MKLTLAFLGLICTANGLNILAILPLSMKSHYAIGFSVIKSSLDVGHNVTAITTFQPEKPIDNYRVVHIPNIMDEYKEQEPNPFVYINLPVIVSMLFMPQFGFDMVNLVMQSEEMQKFLKGDEQFDVCIMELFADEALLGIPEKFGCSLLFYTTFDSPLWSDSVTGNLSPESYVPNPFLYYTDKMTFKERLWNAFIGLIDKGIYHGYILPFQRRLYDKYFPDAKRSFNEMYRNASIVFINNHVSHSFVRPLQPSQIEIGGIHVKPAKPLPDDLQEFLDAATDGVILFTMGSYIDGTDWPLEKREAFIGAFKKLKQKVIWRYSNETLPGNPGNVRIASWLPQRDILAHKNVKVFITHGGLLGTTEALVEGVPVLGIPIFGDQMMNMAKATARGYGKQVLFQDLNEESFLSALHDLINNPSYRETAAKISERFKDRPMTPQETVVYWTEYVARHEGAAHLQAHAVNLNFLEFHSIDVYCVLLAILAVTLYTEFLILKIVCKKIFTKKKPKSNKKKNE